MRAFIVFMCAAALAAEKRGYNYQIGKSNGDLSPESRISIGFNSRDTDDFYDGGSYSSQDDFEKEFYTFSAPENEYDNSDYFQKMFTGVKKNLRVIFIKGPENKRLENAAFALAKQAAEQRTAIYVLNKQTDIAEFGNKFNAISKSINSKPEVHFVKYSTNEDAANAQKAIQSQYDSLGGSSQSHNNGIASVLNFASKARTPTVNAPSNIYLPSSASRRRY